VEQRTISFSEPLDLALTCGPLVRGHRDPSNRLSRDEFWRASNTPEGPATVHIEVCARDRSVQVEAWGKGAEWSIENCSGLIGLDDVDDLDSTHPAIARARTKTRGLRMCAVRAVLDVALPAVIDQRVSGVEAKRTWFGLIRAHGEPAPGPLALRVPPVAERVAALDDYQRRRFGLEARRGAALVIVAKEASRLQRAANKGTDVLQRALLTLPGLGPWTAATVAQLVCGDADAVPVGDWHLPRLVGHALAGEARADDTRMLELLEPFRPHRGSVTRLLAAAGAGPPRIGPRAEIPDLLGRELRGDTAYRVRRSLRFGPQ
jgi:3-methyladenine DNA glycosylase/8-oxoguanine DNA glycosylase